jgi:hypothetical protein
VLAISLAELVLRMRGVGCVCELILAHKLVAQLILDRKTQQSVNVEEEYISSTTLHELLNQQKQFYKDLIDLQENN